MTKNWNDEKSHRLIGNAARGRRKRAPVALGKAGVYLPQLDSGFRRNDGKTGMTKNWNDRKTGMTKKSHRLIGNAACSRRKRARGGNAGYNGELRDANPPLTATFPFHFDCNTDDD